jgi:membrane-associated phospholipid phosphatase
VGWIRAVEWVPYQLPTFVTPAFAGYVSGHSTFSRAAAEVLTSITGSEYWPGGLGEWTIAADSLEFEAGPAEPVTLQWATYADAADEAGRSRLYGGIHVRADDLAGRMVGQQAGEAAWELASRHYAGTVG